MFARFAIKVSDNLEQSPVEAAPPDSAIAKAKAAIIRSGDFIVGLDIGTSKVCAIVGERLPDDTIKVLGVGQAPSLGVRSGEVVDSEAAGKCVTEALIDAERRSDVAIGSTHLAVFGGHSVHGLGSRAANSVRCVEKLDIEVQDVVLRPLASAQAVLDPDQKNLGALVVDMGAGTSSYIVFADRKIKGWGTRGVGGNNITHDLSLALRIPMARAEKLKKGGVWLGQPMAGRRIVPDDESGFACKEVEREMINTIIRCRVRATFARMKAHIETKGVQLESLGAGVHLTGGCSMLRGIDHLAQEIFGIPAHFTRAKGIMWTEGALKNPQYSCALGLLKFGALRTDSSSYEYPGRRYFWVILPPSRLADQP